MIDLKKDLFCSLANCAKDRKDKPIVTKQSSTIKRSAILSDLERASYESVNPAQGEKSKRTMEQTIEEVVSDPRIHELKEELEKAQNIFDTLRDSGMDDAVLERISLKISQLKRLVDEKSYF